MEPDEFTNLLAVAVIAGLVIFAGCSGGSYAAEASACYNVADSDARTYCLARSRREPGQCYSIQRSDLRAQCLAEVRK